MDFLSEGAGVLEVLKEGLPVVPFLATPKECYETVKSLKRGIIGSGNFGYVFSFEVPGHGTRNFALKEILFEVPEGEVPEGASEDLLEILRAYNPGWDGSPGARIRVPNYVTPCVTREDEEYDSTMGEGKVVVPEGSYVCDTETFSEFLIGKTLGGAFERGECVNFFQVHSHFVCKTTNADLYSLNVVMDKVDGDFIGGGTCTRIPKYCGGCPRNAKETIWIGVIVQVIFAIAFYQEKFKLSHNDLHAGNVFVEYVTEDTKFNDQTFVDADWYRYEVKGKEIFLPAIPVIAKIGDFGMSVKYDAPLVGFKGVFNGELTMDGVPVVPNYYYPSYDYMSFLRNVDVRARDKKLRKVTGFLRSLYPEEAFTVRHRPDASSLSDGPTAIEVLLEVMTKRFGKPQTSGKVVTLGVL